MTQPDPAAVPPFDGSRGNLIARAEPKVRAASLTALLAPIALYYLYDYVPGLKALPHPLTALVAALVIGALTFAAGFAAKAVDRIDLFGRALEGRVENVLVNAGDKAFGSQVTEELEDWVHRVHDEVVPPVKAAVHTAIADVEAAVGAGGDPAAAIQAALPGLEAAGTSALDAAVAAGRAEGPALAADAVAGAAAAHPDVAAEVADTVATAAIAVDPLTQEIPVVHPPAPAAGPLPAEASELLHKLLALLEPTPIGDAAAAATPVAQAALPPVPAPAAPVATAAPAEVPPSS